MRGSEATERGKILKLAFWCILKVFFYELITWISPLLSLLLLFCLIINIIIIIIIISSSSSSSSSIYVSLFA